MVSSLVYAFSIFQTLSNVPAKQTAVVPVFNIPREDFCLRTEAVFLFKQFHLDLGFFTFIEDIELETLMETKKLKLTLVDHNVLVQAQKYLETAVIEILDHHRDMWPAELKVNKTIELVGSCCTLVAEKLLAVDILDNMMCSLLLGTILLDTINLDPRAGKTTDKDEQIVSRLMEQHPVAVDELYVGLSKAKFDVSAISTPDLLRKDYKALPNDSSEALSVSISAVSGLSLQEFFSRAQVQHHIMEYCESSCLDVLVIMFVYFGDGLNEPPSKQLAVCGPNQDASGQIGDYLCTSAELKLKQRSESYENCFVYDQENVKATRKDVFPLVHAFLQNKL
ncbi:exopolyphosphatase PRUNE1-like [Porites lutea]|uniref:exopolyphosphatase PRUNE1-like n=1 Tax=Porites lutea TaxID=51062 RepID=UPI003CC59A60